MHRRWLSTIAIVAALVPYSVAAETLPIPAKTYTVRRADQSPVVVVGGNGDVPLGDIVVAQLPPGRGFNAAGRLSLLAAAELIGRAAALVGNDSAPQHLASAMGTPTVTVYGPTIPDFGFGPLAPRSATVGLSDLACRPCHRHGPARCPLGHWRCMRELSSRQVFEALMGILSSAETV